MEIKILQVFYDKNGLPYKDKERTVHYPITSGTFLGASNTTQIRFYYDQLDELNESTFVAVSKLPNGKIGSEILESEYDSELQENYAVLNLSQFYTQYKGDVYISLQGYQGGVRVEQDEDGIYQIYGTPTIQATGSIKLSIAYAPTFIGNGQTENITLQRVLAELSTKLGIRQETLHVEELPTVGNPNVWYVINNDPNDPTKTNIYIWNATTQTYVWVGDNTLNLGDYYTTEQGQEFEEEIDQRIAYVENTFNGSPKGVYSTLADLQAAYPTGTEGIYVVSADGHWYYWNGSAWADGGLYQTPVDYDELVHQSNQMLSPNPDAPYDDADTFPANEIVSVASGVGVSNLPVSGGWSGQVITFYNQGSGQSITCQIAIDSSGKLLTREKFGISGTWTGWRLYLGTSKLFNQVANLPSPYNDCNSLPVNEIVTYFVSTPSNSPSGSSQFTILTLLGDYNDGIGIRVQLAIDSENNLRTRRNYGGSWSEWSSSVNELSALISGLTIAEPSLIDLTKGSGWSSGPATVTNATKYSATLANGYYIVNQSFVAGDEIDIYVKCDKKLAFYIASDYTYNFEIDATNGKFEKHTIKYDTNKTPLFMIGNTTETVNVEMYVAKSGIPLNPKADLNTQNIEKNAQKLIQISDPTLIRTGGVWLCTSDYPSWYGASGFNGLRVDVSQYKKIAIYGANTPSSFACFTTSNNRKISNLNNDDKVYDVPTNAKWLLISGSDDVAPQVFNFDYVTLGVDVSQETNEYEHIYGVGKFDYIVRGSNTKDISGYCSMAMFPKMAVIGDSYSSGLVYDENGGIGADYQLSWLMMMARRNGAVGTCYSYGGANTHTWLENQDHGLPVMLADTPKNLYFIMLGINDSSTVTLGTIADATDDYDNNPDTYYGNYARIIRNIQVHAPNSKIILICPPMSAYNGAVIDLANKYGLPYITTTDDYFSSQYYILKYGHPVASSYAGMSMIYEKESIKAILNNPDYFNDYVCDGPLS